MRTVALPMYDLPELRAATDAWWTALADRLRRRGIADVPAQLDRERQPLAIWRDPGLLLAQTCGYPLRMQLGRSVQVVATPRYRTPHCQGAWYRSVVVVRTDAAIAQLVDLLAVPEPVYACNAMTSHSGMNAPRALLAPLAGGRERLFHEVRVTGSHRASLELVAAGEATITAVDGVTFALLQRVAPNLVADLRVIAETAACPGLPLVTGSATTPQELADLRAALHELAEDPQLASVRDALVIDGFEELTFADYAAVDVLEAAAGDVGYPQLR